MGAYLVLYFISLVLALSFYWISKLKKNKLYESLASFTMLLMLFFLVIALATKDPIDELLTTIPAFWQFLLTALGGAFTIWKVYLNPLKERVITLETKTKSIDTKLDGMKDTLDWIKSNFDISMKKY